MFSFVLRRVSLPHVPFAISSVAVVSNDQSPRGYGVYSKFSEDIVLGDVRGTLYG